MNEPIKVYDLKEVCSILKINLRVLRRYIKEEKIRASKIGRKYVITAEDLEAYIKGNSNKPTSFYEMKLAERQAQNEPKEEIGTEQKALLEAMLTKADAEAPIKIDLKEYTKLIGIKSKTDIDIEASIEASLNELMSLYAITEQNLRGVLITSKSSVINSYKKLNGSYEVELNKDLVKLFKENMLINTKIVKK